MPGKSFYISALILLLPVMATGQNRGFHTEISVEQILHQIEKEYREGALSMDEALQQKFYVAADPEKAMERFRPVSEDQRLRCLTPLIIEYHEKKEDLSFDVRQELQNYVTLNCSRPSTDESYLSPSGRFRIHFSRSGQHAVPLDDTNGSGIPDYVERTAFAADSSWSHQVQRLGYADPIILQDLEPYEIYFKNFGYYGMTCSSMGTSYIIIHNNFSGFPTNDHPEGDQIGALYVTTAHEFKHASQYATNNWQGDAGSFDWVEMDATMMEEVNFNDVNDFHNYLTSSSSIFRSPSSPIPGAYWHVSWMLYFAEEFGDEFWADVWNQFEIEPTKPVLQAVKESLSRFQAGFEEEHTQNLLWHMGSGPDYSPTNFGFQERLHYPNPTFGFTFSSVPDSLQNRSLSPLAGRFYLVRPVDNEMFGQTSVVAEHNLPGLGIGLIGYFKDGTIRNRTFLGNNQITRIQTDWNWEDLQELGIAVINYNETETANFNLKVDDLLPQQITLRQNFPNPFNPATNIEFTVDTPQTIRLDIYNTLGRHIQTLTNRRYEPGFYTLEFDGSGLASGIYLYRLTSEQGSLIKKMILVK